MNKTEPVREREERQALRSFVVRLCGSSEVTNYGSTEVTNYGSAEVRNYRSAGVTDYGSGRSGRAVCGGIRNFQTLGHCGFHTAELRKFETSAVSKWSSL